MDLGLENRACVITGGSRGIGLRVARRLLDEGARVLLIGRSEAALAEVGRSLGDAAAWLAVDITAPEAGERIAVACQERFERLDVLVNNAGGNDLIELEDLTDDEWRAQFEIHVMAPMRLMRAAIPVMVRSGWGRVVNVASTSGRRPGRNNLAYGVSKAAELSLSRGFAEHYAPAGVLVNAVNPGPVASELWLEPGGLLDQIVAARGGTRESTLEQLSAGLPLERMGTAEEIADVIVFLCSERVGNVVGAAWAADSGAVPSIF